MKVGTNAKTSTQLQSHPKGERSEILEGIHSMNPVFLMLSPQRWLDQGGQNLQGVLEIVVEKEFF